MFKRDKAGNLLWVERLWEALPHWLRRRIGFLFPVKKFFLFREDEE